MDPKRPFCALECDPVEAEELKAEEWESLSMIFTAEEVCNESFRSLPNNSLSVYLPLLSYDINCFLRFFLLYEPLVCCIYLFPLVPFQLLSLNDEEVKLKITVGENNGSIDEVDGSASLSALLEVLLLDGE